MPPKPVKKKIENVDDKSGIEKQEVTFNFTFHAAFEQLENVLFQFDWISETKPGTLEKIIAPPFETWTLTPKEPTSTYSGRYVYKQTFESIRIDDEWVKCLCKNEIKITFVNLETNKVLDELSIDMSSILLHEPSKPPAKNICFTYFSKYVKVHEIENFGLDIEVDKSLISPIYKHYLNPCCVEVVGAKDLAIDEEYIGSRFLPIYVKYQFFKERSVATQCVPTESTCRWNHKHVFLTGFYDQKDFSTYLRTNSIIFEIHDKDEVKVVEMLKDSQIMEIKEEIQYYPPPPENPKDKLKGKNAPPPPAKQQQKEEKKDDKKKKDPKKPNLQNIKLDNLQYDPPSELNIQNYSICKFSFMDFLNPHAKILRLKNQVCPRKLIEESSEKMLDLNTTARKELRVAEAFCNHMDKGAFLVIIATLPFVPGSYKHIPPVVEEAPKKGAQAKQVPAPAPAKGAKAVEIKPVEEQPQKVVINEFAKTLLPKFIFERCVFLMSYNDNQMVKRLQDFVTEINLKAFNIQAKFYRELKTKKLTEEEKASQTLDYISGVEFIDSVSRLYILEGLLNGAMNQLAMQLPREKPNTKEFKILKNNNLSYQKRMYADFNTDIKRIRLRKNLSDIIKDPSLYLRQYVPENIYQTFMTIKNIKLCDNMTEIYNRDLYPNISDILVIETKYGDAPSDEDIYGKELSNTIKFQTKKNLHGEEPTQTAGPNMDEIPMMPELASTKLQLSINDSQLPKININISGMTLSSSDIKPSIEEKSIQPINDKTKMKSLLHSTKKRSTDEYNMRIQEQKNQAPPDNYYPCGFQKLNYIEQLKAAQREQIRKDKDNFYTYSNEYLSLSIDPYTVDEVKKFDEVQKKEKFLTEKGFLTVVPRNKDEFRKMNKDLHPTTIELIKDNPYHEQKKITENTFKQNLRGKAIPNDFNTNISPSNAPFSEIQVNQADKITAVEVERLKNETKKIAQDEWKSKLVVESPYFHVDHKAKISNQIDKFKGVLTDQAKKSGLILPKEKVNLKKTATIENHSPSFNLEEKFVEKQIVLNPNRFLKIQEAMSVNEFVKYMPNINQKTIIYKPPHPSPLD